VNSTARLDHGQIGSFEQFLQKLMRLKVEMLTNEMLEQNPCCMQMLQELVKLKKQPTTLEWISLARDHANTKVESYIKIKDPGTFNVPISINGVFLGDALCELAASIDLMSMEIFKIIKGMKMVPAQKLLGVAGGTLHQDCFF